MLNPFLDQTNPLIAALLDGGLVPDGQGGRVPLTNSRVLPDGSLRPFDPAMDLQAGAGPLPVPARPQSPGAMQAPLAQLPALTGGRSILAPSLAPSQAMAQSLAQAGQEPGSGQEPGPELTPYGSPLNSYQQALKHQYDIAHSTWEVASRRAREAAQAAMQNPALRGAAKIYQDSASQALKTANEYVGEYIKTLKQPDPPQVVSPGQGVFNPRIGKYEVAIPARDKPESRPASIEEYEYGLAHPDFARAPKWVPGAGPPDPYGNPTGAWVSPPNPAQIKQQQEELQDSAAGDPSLAGDAYLKTLDPRMADTVKGIAEGRISVTPRKLQTLVPFVARYDPNFTQQDYAARQTAFNSFASLSPSSAGGQIKSANQAIAHASEGIDLIDKLGNFTYLPAIMNPARSILQSQINPEYQDARARFDKAVTALSSELAKVFTGNAPALETIRHWREGMDASSASPVTLRAGISEAMRLLNGGIEAIASRYNEAYKSNRPGREFLTEGNRKAFDALILGRGHPDPGEQGGAAQPIRPGPAAAPSGGQAASGPGLPKIGDILGGYRYKGGDLADRSSWERP